MIWMPETDLITNLSGGSLGLVHHSTIASLLVEAPVRRERRIPESGPVRIQPEEQNQDSGFLSTIVSLWNFDKQGEFLKHNKNYYFKTNTEGYRGGNSTSAEEVLQIPVSLP